MAAPFVPQRTVTAMTKVGILPEQQESVFATVAAVLHLGNITFVDGREPDSSAVEPGKAQEHLQAAGEPAADLMDIFCIDRNTWQCMQQ